MKAAYCALLTSVVAATTYASPSATRPDAQTMLQMQCIDDVEVLWAVADTYKADRNAYEESVRAALRQLAASDPRRARTIRLLALIESDARFRHFAVRDFADRMENTCANPAQRFDPFNWDGAIPPGRVS